MMNIINHPSDWQNTLIGDVCTLINGRAFKQTEWSNNGLPIIRIQNLNKPKASFNYFEGELDERHHVRKGDLLFAWSGTPGTSFGTHEWKGADAALNQHIFKISFSETQIHKSFFRYAIDQKLDELIGSANGGVGLRHITKGTFEKTKISFPPLAEQKVIAEKLDTLLEQVETTKARFERIPHILKTFRQSVLTAAISGKLTEEWRNIKNIKINSWTDGVLGDFVDKPTYGSSSKSQPEGTIPVLRMGNLQGGELDWTNLVYTSDPVEINKYKLSYGDVLFNRTNSPELVGKTSIYRGEREAIYAGYLIRVVCKENLDPEFLNYLLNSPDAKDYCYQVKSDGVSQSNINAQKLIAFPIKAPTMIEQREIVRRVEEFFNFAYTIEQKNNAALERVNNLTQSILAKAFRGELTADWRDTNPDLISGDNSAKALLERIKAEREELKKQQKTKSTEKKKTGSRMSKQIIKVVDALKEAGKPLSGQQLLASAGYPSDSSTEKLEQFFLDVREALTTEKSIVKLERDDDGQDWFALAEQSVTNTES